MAIAIEVHWPTCRSLNSLKTEVGKTKLTENNRDSPMMQALHVNVEETFRLQWPLYMPDFFSLSCTAMV